MGRLRPADLVAAAGGLALLAAMFLHWYGISVEVLATGGPSRRSSSRRGRRSTSSTSCSPLLAFVPLALLVAQATRESPAFPVLFSVLTIVAGALAALLILYRIVNQPGPNATVEVEAGAWLGLLAALIAAAGGWWSTRDERMPGAAPRPIEHMPAPGRRRPARPERVARHRLPAMLSRDQVLHVARLARLELSEDEVGRMSEELSKVLDNIGRSPSSATSPASSRPRT